MRNTDVPGRSGRTSRYSHSNARTMDTNDEQRKVVSEAAPAPAPVKRRLFQNAASRQVTKEKEGVELFSRSAELFASIVSEERKQRRQERERKISQGEEKAQASTGDGDDKKRRVSDDGDVIGSGREAAEEDGTISQQMTPPRRDIRSATKESAKDRTPTPKAKRFDSPHKRILRSSERETIIDVIDVSDSDDDVQLAREDKPDDSVEKPKEDEADISDEEFPELIAQARAKAQQSLIQQRVQDRLKLLRSKNGKETDPASPASLTTAEDPIVQILVSSNIEGTSALLVRRKMSQRLKDVRMAWCDRQLIDNKPLTNAVKAEIFLTWRGQRVFDVTTCKSMGIKPHTEGSFQEASSGVDHQGRVHLEAWTDSTFAEWKAQQERRKQQHRYDPFDDEEEDDAVPQAPPPDESKIRVILKAKDLEPFNLRIKPTTTIQQMLDIFRSQREVPAEQTIALYLDGDKLDPAGLAGEQDLEDLCTIDVHIH